MKELTANSAPPKSKVPLYLSLLLVAILVGSYFAVPAVRAFLDEAWKVLTSDDEARIQAWVEGFGWFGPILLIMAMIAQMFLLVIPTILLMIVAILAYGPIWGSLIAFVAVFVASSAGYSIGKYVGTGVISGLLGQKTFEKVSSFLQDYGFWAVMITRLIPFLSNDAISFVAGILKMNYFKFISATLLGISPLIIFIAATGKNTESLTNGLLWGSLISLTIFGIYIWWDKKKQTAK